MAENQRFRACWASFVPGWLKNALCWASFSRVSGGEGVLGKFCRVYRHGSQVSQVRWSPTCRKWWGFCSIRSWLAACRRRVAALMVQFPPFGGGEAASQAGVVPTVQTTSVNNADNGVLWAKWSAFWAQRCLSWRVVSM